MKYYANFNANNGTRYAKDITDTNKERIIKTISSVANGNRFAGNDCSWRVHNEHGKCVAYGYTLPSGQRCRIHGSDLRFYDED
jgi:hypothetical protein